MEGILKIENDNFDQDLLDKKSKKYQELSSEIEREIKEALFDYQTINYGANDITVKVIDFS